MRRGEDSSWSSSRLVRTESTDTVFSGEKKYFIDKLGRNIWLIYDKYFSDLREIFSWSSSRLVRTESSDTVYSGGITK